MSTIFGLLALIAYAYGLGAGSVVVWRYYPHSPLRYAPAVATLTYYTLALFVAYPPAYQATRDGAVYPWDDVARNWASAVAFGSCLLLITRALLREKGRHDDPL